MVVEQPYEVANVWHNFAFIFILHYKSSLPPQWYTDGIKTRPLVGGG
jgi:hypothetical protein